MGGETGANPIEAMQGGELAETLANAMAGIADMYDQLLDDARARTENSDVSNGFNVFKNSTYQSFIDVQTHGGLFISPVHSRDPTIVRKSQSGTIQTDFRVLPTQQRLLR